MEVAMCWLVSGWRPSMMVTCNDTTAVMFELCRCSIHVVLGFKCGLMGCG
jgi:hypothetical protein